MARTLEAVIEALPASATVVLNGDDPLVASLAPGASARRLYFGIRAGGTGRAGARSTPRTPSAACAASTC